MSSEVYKRLKDTYGTVDTSSYGPLEVKVVDDWEEECIIYHGQTKPGKKLCYHGRGCLITKYDGLFDIFWRDGCQHGPWLQIRQDGTYKIVQYDDGYVISEQLFNPDGTTLSKW